jgi:hypothetical protein
MAGREGAGLARIVVIRHKNERQDFSTYMLHPLLQIWEEQGHEIRIVCGIDDLPEADLAILHIDLTLVPDEYAEAVRRYPRVVNGRTLDVSKRNVSSILLKPGDDWEGKVVVKADLNCFGVPEYRVYGSAASGYPTDLPELPVGYTIYPRLERVPDRAWQDPRLVVERFMPEKDGEYFLLRVYSFCGSGTRNRICKAKRPIIRGRSIVDHWAGPEVPEELIAERERLGMDFGKFDYVVYEGRPILLDANKTPAGRAGLPREMFEDLAAGLPALLA